jgi:hypothetical protein
MSLEIRRRSDRLYELRPAPISASAQLSFPCLTELQIANLSAGRAGQMVITVRLATRGQQAFSSPLLLQLKSLTTPAVKTPLFRANSSMRIPVGR